MDISLNKDQQKSIVLTTIVMGLLLLILFFIRFWPPSNLKELMGGGGGGGIEMNFGDSDFGMGENFKSEVLNVKEEAKQAPTPTSNEDNIITEDDAADDVVAMPKNEKVKKPTPVVEKVVTKPVIEKPKVSKNTNDALSNLLNSNKGGDGNDKTGGNKGRPDGKLSSNGYSGSGSGTGSGTGSGSGNGSGSGSGNGSGSGSGTGNGNGSGYYLGNRKALIKPTPNYTCNEQGKVAVQISVDKSGNVIDAKPGTRGTTNAAKCLLDEAKSAAMRTKWQADNDAPDKQVGIIIYNFNLN
jgi:hypothetical protein